MSATIQRLGKKLAMWIPGDGVLVMDDSQANQDRMRLIAAAPDLLEACIQTEHVISGGPMTLAEAQRLLRAAISKALGHASIAQSANAVEPQPAPEAAEERQPQKKKKNEKQS